MILDQTLRTDTEFSTREFDAVLRFAMFRGRRRESAEDFAHRYRGVWVGGALGASVLIAAGSSVTAILVSKAPPPDLSTPEGRAQDMATVGNLSTACPVDLAWLRRIVDRGSWKFMGTANRGEETHEGLLAGPPLLQGRNWIESAEVAPLGPTTWSLDLALLEPATDIETAVWSLEKAEARKLRRDAGTPFWSFHWAVPEAMLQQPVRMRQALTTDPIVMKLQAPLSRRVAIVIVAPRHP